MRNAERMQKDVVKAVKAKGCQTVETHAFDLGSDDINKQMNAFIADIKKRHGKIDLVISNGIVFLSQTSSR